MEKKDKYIVLKKTSEKLSKGHWTYIALINRNKNKEHWWTVDFDEAFKFTSKEAANKKAKSLKYGQCIAIEATQFDKYVGREFYKVKIKGTSLTKELQSKRFGFDCDGNEVSYDDYKAAKDIAFDEWGFEYKEHIKDYM